MVVERKNKYEGILRSLRREIVQGVYGPGHRLPNRSEMVEEFGVSVATVQRALDVLTEDGFVHGRPGAGTFVAENPPHLCNYAIVISASIQWSRFFTALRKAVGSIQTDDTMRFREYLTSRDVGSRRDVVRLSKDVSGHRLAGVIFAGSPVDLEGTPALEQPNMPRVLIEWRSEHGCPAVFADLTSFTDRAVEYLVSQGRRRVAFLGVDYPPYLSNSPEEFGAALRERGLEVRPYWIQTIPVGEVFRSAANVVNLLMQLEGEKRPDALIIYDDNLVEHAVAGLLAAGVKVPQELEVVAQCNYPSPVPSALPLKRLGFDCQMILEECLRVLEMQRRGETPPEMTKVPAVFEDEVDSEGM